MLLGQCLPLSQHCPQSLVVVGTGLGFVGAIEMKRGPCPQGIRGGIEAPVF